MVYNAIFAKHSGKYLDVFAIGMNNGTNVQQWDYYKNISIVYL